MSFLIVENVEACVGYRKCYMGVYIEGIVFGKSLLCGVRGAQKLGWGLQTLLMRLHMVLFSTLLAIKDLEPSNNFVSNG